MVPAERIESSEPRSWAQCFLICRRLQQFACRTRHACLVSRPSDEAEHAATHSFGSKCSLYLVLIISNFSLSLLACFLQTSYTVPLYQYHAGPVTSVKFTLRCTTWRIFLNPYIPLSATPYFPSNISSAILRTSISIFAVMCIAGAVSVSSSAQPKDAVRFTQRIG